MRRFFVLMTLLCLHLPAYSGGCTAADVLPQALAPSIVPGMKLRLSAYWISIPPPDAVSPSADAFLALYNDGKAIGFQHILDVGDERYSAALFYKKIYGLAPLEDSDDRDVILALRETGCSDPSRLLRYGLPGDHTAVMITVEEWYQVFIFTPADTVVKLDFKGFPLAEIEAMLASLTDTGKRRQ